jgi:hypothetical protein
MPRHLLARSITLLIAVAVGLPPPSMAQPKPASVAEKEATESNVEQLDAILAPIALYPDELLTQTLMASTYPLQVVAVALWLEEGNNKKVKGDGLIQALEDENWDPSVKSLVPFAQTIAMMNDDLEWTQLSASALARARAAIGGQDAPSPPMRPARVSSDRRWSAA